MQRVSLRLGSELAGASAALLALVLATSMFPQITIVSPLTSPVKAWRLTRSGVAASPKMTSPTSGAYTGGRVQAKNAVSCLSCVGSVIASGLRPCPGALPQR